MESAQERTTAPGNNMQDDSTFMVRCTSCYMFADQKEEESGFICQKCQLVALLEEKVKGLEERIATLKLIRENEDFLDMTEASLLTTDGEGSVREPPIEQEWKHVTKRSKRTVMTSTTMQLRNSFQGLGEDDDVIPKDGVLQASMERPTSKEKGETQRQPAISAIKQAKKKRRVVVVGDSLLRGTEAPICRPDREAREVCCLPGAKIKDVTARIPKLFSSKDVHPFLLIHVGTNDTARKDLPTICRDFEELGKQVKQLDAQVVFSSILPTDGHGTRRWNRILEVNNWLRQWCRQQRFGFLDHGINYLYDGLLARDGLHLNKPGKYVFGRKIAALIRRALN